MKYVAFLRGIGPGNPNMRNEKLRGVFEDLGFKNVQSVISSGNILFESESQDIEGLETLLEAAWQDKLGFKSTTIIKTKTQLENLVKLDPFGGLQHSPKSYLLVTFFKHPTTSKLALPHQPAGKTYKITGLEENALFSVTDNTAVKTTDLMSWLEKQFGKEISSRTWGTVNRVLKKMG